jgi:hypothetical protein
MGSKKKTIFAQIKQKNIHDNENKDFILPFSLVDGFAFGNGTISQT